MMYRLRNGLAGAAGAVAASPAPWRSSQSASSALTFPPAFWARSPTYFCPQGPVVLPGTEVTREAMTALQDDASEQRGARSVHSGGGHEGRFEQPAARAMAMHALMTERSDTDIR
jgi:hypothetical protein